MEEGVVAAPAESAVHVELVAADVVPPTDVRLPGRPNQCVGDRRNHDLPAMRVTREAQKPLGTRQLPRGDRIMREHEATRMPRRSPERLCDVVVARSAVVDSEDGERSVFHSNDGVLIAQRRVAARFE